MANWTAEGFVGKTVQVTSKMVPLPPGVPVPVLWGDENIVRDRLTHGVSSLSLTRRYGQFRYPFGPKEVVEFFRQYFGPTQVAFSRLDATGQSALASELESLWIEHNKASDGTTNVDAEYLDVRAIRR